MVQAFTFRNPLLHFTINNSPYQNEFLRIHAVWAVRSHTFSRWEPELTTSASRKLLSARRCQRCLASSFQLPRPLPAVSHRLPSGLLPGVLRWPHRGLRSGPCCWPAQGAPVSPASPTIGAERRVCCPVALGAGQGSWEVWSCSSVRFRCRKCPSPHKFNIRTVQKLWNFKPNQSQENLFAGGFHKTDFKDISKTKLSILTATSSLPLP